jgi:hypothetical protein
MIRIDDIITTDGYLQFCNKNNICYIKTDFFYIGSQFNWRGEIHPKYVDKVCVVGHSDYPIVEEISSRFDKIFCINRCNKNENTFGLPLGITNDCDDSLLHKIYGNKEIMIEVINQNIDKSNLSYMNFNISNYPIERQFVFDKFKNENWVVIGDIGTSLDSRIKFLQDIKSSKFVFCPRGNGVDTHRIWESLYMGSIPIVIYEETHHLFNDLPILFIKDWSEITEEFLNEKYDEYNKKSWNLEKLKIEYWTNFIKNNI